VFYIYILEQPPSFSTLTNGRFRPC